MEFSITSNMEQDCIWPQRSVTKGQEEKEEEEGVKIVGNTSQERALCNLLNYRFRQHR